MQCKGWRNRIREGSGGKDGVVLMNGIKVGKRKNADMFED